MARTFKYEKFEDPTEEFNEKESRTFCYDVALRLIKEAKSESRKSRRTWYAHEKTIQSILLIIFCWNFAARKTKKQKAEDVKELLKETWRELEALKKYNIRNFMVNDKNMSLIKEVYGKFMKQFDQTGATKALSVLNPRLFVMWDTEIRECFNRTIKKEKKDKKEEYKKTIGQDISSKTRSIHNGEGAQDYLNYLIFIRNIIKSYKALKKYGSDTIAKKIDEFHYIKK